MPGEKTTITKNEYLQVGGLSTVARYHRRLVQGAEKSLAELLGVEWGGHIGDAILSDDIYTADLLLEQLGIAVEGDRKFNAV